jgi:UrcA family protein
MKVFDRSRIAKRGGHTAGRVLSMAALVAAMTVALSASATPVTDAPTVAVRFGDLNLASDAGTQVLFRRLSYAAHQVCGHAGPHEFARITEVRACYRQALGNAVASIHNERVSALYRAHEG